MKQMVIFLITFFLAVHFAGESLNRYAEISEIQKVHSPIESRLIMKDTLRKKYKWYTDRIFKAVYRETENYYEKDTVTFYKMVSVIYALIDAESRGKIKATGPTVGVYLNRRGKLVKEYHKARGLMQVMSFNAEDLKPYQLYSVNHNIRSGMRVFIRSMQAGNRSLRETLKNYNSGINSDYYNEPYIEKIYRNYRTVFTAWKFQKDNVYIVLFD